MPTPTATLPAGTYGTTITEVDVPAAFPAEAIPLFIGQWQTTFSEGGRFTIAKDGEVVVEGRYTVTTDQLIFTDEKGPMNCADAGEGPSGTYQWNLDGKTLPLTLLEDDCLGRVTVLTAHPWSRQD